MDGKTTFCLTLNDVVPTTTPDVSYEPMHGETTTKR